jgi:hypothetical protein
VKHVGRGLPDPAILELAQIGIRDGLAGAFFDFSERKPLGLAQIGPGADDCRRTAFARGPFMPFACDPVSVRLFDESSTMYTSSSDARVETCGSARDLLASGSLAGGLTSRTTRARARFWAEVREGQREAEERVRPPAADSREPSRI